MGSWQEKQLGQSRPANTNAASLYSPGTDVTAIIKTIIVCNTTGSAVTFRLFLDDNGTTYDQTTALFYDADIGGAETVQIDGWFPMNDSSGNFAIRTSSASALTFTIFGVEIKK